MYNLGCSCDIEATSPPRVDFFISILVEVVKVIISLARLAFYSCWKEE